MIAIFIDALKLALAAAFLHYSFRTFIRRRRSHWIGPLEQRRIAIWAILVLSLLAIKIGERALDGESGPFDKATLLFIHGSFLGSWTRLFGAVTLTGSSNVLGPLAAAATLGLLIAGRRAESFLLGASTLSGALAVYFIKLAADRTRPALWDTKWYWGSSFPSGHTLVVAAFATAGALCVKRLRPKLRRRAWAVAMTWIASVGFSRLALGVHWPTDVMAAACVGLFIPLAISIGMDLRGSERTADDPPSASKS